MSRVASCKKNLGVVESMVGWRVALPSSVLRNIR